jgi:glycosyltransferase involved in cell wall biosynthesis
MKSTFKSSIYISSISPEFLKWALGQIPRSQKYFDKVNYLSCKQGEFSKAEVVEAENYWDSLGIKDDGSFRCSYIGSLSSTLDFERVFEAAKETGLAFVIAGNGACKEKFMRESSNLTNVIFPGWISAAQSFVLAKRSSMLIAPYLDLEDFKISLPNKFIDAMMHGKPMLTCLSGFPKEFIENNEIGRFYEKNQIGSLVNLIVELSGNSSAVAEMGLNARRLFEKAFNGEMIYSSLADYLEEIVEMKIP